MSELYLVEGAREVPIPYAGGSEFVCPGCERPIPTIRQIRLGKPPKYEAQLNDVFRCPLPAPNGNPDKKCGFIFSPRSTAIVLRR